MSGVDRPPVPLTGDIPSVHLGKLVGALDVGTSSVKFLVFVAATGELVTFHRMSLSLVTSSPAPDQVVGTGQESWARHEVDAHALVDISVQCIDGAVSNLRQLDVDPGDITCVGFSSLPGTVFAWDRSTSEAAYPYGILDNDSRTRDEAENLSRCPRRFHLRLPIISGLSLSARHPALKLKWLQSRCLGDEGSASALPSSPTLMLGTCDSWLLWNLTSSSPISHTDVTNASLTGLMNLKSLEWDPDLCRFFGIDKSLLPKIRSCSEDFGNLSCSQLAGIPVSGVMASQQAALLGQGCLDYGTANLELGRRWNVMLNTGSRIFPCLLEDCSLSSVVAHRLGAEAPVVYGLSSSRSRPCGLIVDRLSRTLLNLDREEFEELSRKKLAKGGKAEGKCHDGLFVVPPDLYDDRIGPKVMMVDLDERASREDFCEAVLESLAFQVRSVREEMESCIPDFKLSQLLVDGGMSQNDLLAQLLADHLGLTVSRPSMPEAAALGATIAAGLAEGVPMWKVSKNQDLAMDRFTPRMVAAQRDVQFEKWKINLEIFQGLRHACTAEQSEKHKEGRVDGDGLTEGEKRLRASIPAAIFIWTSFLLWKISSSIHSSI